MSPYILDSGAAMLCGRRYLEPESAQQWLGALGFRKCTPEQDSAVNQSTEVPFIASNDELKQWSEHEYMNIHQRDKTYLKWQKTSLKKFGLCANWFFSLVDVSSINMEGGGVNDLYCSQPLGGDQDILASFTQSFHDVHPHLQSMFQTRSGCTVYDLALF